MALLPGATDPKLHVEYYSSVVQYRFDLKEVEADIGVRWKVEVDQGCYGILRGKGNLKHPCLIRRNAKHCTFPPGVILFVA